MTEQEEKEKDVAAEETGDDACATEKKAACDENGVGGFVILFFIVGFAASLILGWGIFPKLLYSQKKQPIDFNHVLHIGEVDEECNSCHFFREDGSFSGVPKLEQCIDCHEEAQGEDPNEIKLVDEYISKNREVPWLVYSKQPDCVFFPHVAHVNMAKMECNTCHGHIGESEHSRIYEENRISGYSRDIWGKNIAGLKKNTSDRMKMDDCAECHATGEGRDSSVQTKKEACFVCHK